MVVLLLVAAFWLPGGDRALNRALENNDPTAMQQALAKGADVNLRMDRRTTALQYALVHNQANMARDLLAAGADPALTNKQGRNAVHTAAAYGRLAMLRRLLTADAPADLTDKAGYSPLHLAVLRGDWPMVRHFIQQDAQVKRTVDRRTMLADAILRGHFAIAKDLIAAGATLNAPGQGLDGQAAVTLLKQRDFTGLVQGDRHLLAVSPLVAALDRQDRGELTTLLATMDFQERDPFGPLPLYLATLFDDLTSIEAMVAQGADFGYTNTLGSPPLVAAIMMGRTEAAAHFLQDIRINAECWLFTSHPLDAAILMQDPAMVNLLFDAGFRHTSPGVRPLADRKQLFPLDKAQATLLAEAPLGAFIDLARVVKHRDTRLAPFIAGTHANDPRDFEQQPQLGGNLHQMLFKELPYEGPGLIISQLTLAKSGQLFDIQPLYITGLDSDILLRVLRLYNQGLAFKPAIQDGQAATYRDMHLIEINTRKQ